MSSRSRRNSASHTTLRDAEFIAFHRENRQKLTNYITRLSRGRVEGQDVASEALLKLYEAWDTVPPEDRAIRLYTIARRKTISQLRKAAVSLKAAQLIGNSRRDAWHPDLGQRLELEETWAAIDRLPPKRRDVLLLHVHGLTDDEIASVMKIKKRSVATYLAKARLELAVTVGNTERRQRRTAPSRSNLTSEGGRTP